LPREKKRTHEEYSRERNGEEGIVGLISFNISFFSRSDTREGGKKEKKKPEAEEGRNKSVLSGLWQGKETAEKEGRERKTVFDVRRVGRGKKKKRKGGVVCTREGLKEGKGRRRPGTAFISFLAGDVLIREKKGKRKKEKKVRTDDKRLTREEEAVRALRAFG